MPEVQDLIFTFGADVTKFNYSMGEVAQKLKELKDRAKTATGGEIPELNKQIAQLTESLKNLKALGNTPVAPLEKVADSAKGARIALTNVSQIAQDLPFGFIGIQNNIPGLVQSFGKLSSESGGVVAALKAMGSALIGPAGIFLAFSVATAAVTTLISKYGSLSAGLDALGITTVPRVLSVSTSVNSDTIISLIYSFNSDFFIIKILL
jgi:hypothetical protein